jgi:hypothetical protein
VIILGLVTTFIGFTLSTSVQEYLKGLEQKKRLEDTLGLLIYQYDREEKKVSSAVQELKIQLFNKEGFQLDKVRMNSETYLFKEFLSSYKKIQESEKIMIINMDIYSSLSPFLKLEVAYTSYDHLEKYYEHVNSEINTTNDVVFTYLNFQLLQKELTRRKMILELEKDFLNDNFSLKQYLHKRDQQENHIQKNYELTLNQSINLIKKSYPSFPSEEAKQTYLSLRWVNP